MGPTSLQELWLQYRNLFIVTKLAKSSGHCKSDIVNMRFFLPCVALLDEVQIFAEWG